MKKKWLSLLLAALMTFVMPLAVFADDGDGGDVPDTNVEWTIDDFTIDGTTITGLSESGQEKIQISSALVLPDKNAEDEYITAIGNGTAGVGTFGYKTSDATYVPTSVVFPEKLESIGNFAFSAVIDTVSKEQVGLTEVNFPNTLKTIGNTAFQNAPLSEVVLPDSVTTLGNGAFTNQGNKKITQLTLSKGLTEIPASAFGGHDIHEVIIPDSVTKIGSRAFNGCHVDTLVMPDGITEIGSNAFENNQLTEVVLPAETTKVGASAFKIYQTGLSPTITRVVLNDKVEDIGRYAFQSALTSDVTEIAIPETLTTLNKDAFKDNNTVSLVTMNQDQATASGAYTKVVTNGTGHNVVCLYTITFNPNDGESDSTTKITNVEGKVAELPTLENRGLTEFVGWFTAEDEEVTADTVFTTNTEVTAKWYTDEEAQEALNNANEAIAAIPDEITADNRAAAEAAIEAYNALPDNAKALVSGEDTLKVKLAEASIAKLDADAAKAEAEAAKAEADAAKEAAEQAKAAADKVQAAVVKTPGKVGSLKVKAGKKKATISFKKASNATQYQILRATKKNGKYKVVKTVTSSKASISYTNKKLKKGKTYYYKVRAINKKGSTYVYGSYSAVKKVKAK